MKKITQKTLTHYATLVNQIEKLNAEAKELKGDLIDSINRGVKVENGARIARVDRSERRNVSWKNVVIRLKSIGYTRQVLAGTEGVTVFKLVVK